MKRIFSIVLTLALLLGAASCTNLLDQNLRVPAGVQQIEEGAKVTLYFSTPEEVKTKADMAALPNVTTMHVFVFNKVGLLLETAEAKYLGNVTSNGTGGAKHWAVDLQMGAAERHLHFIADLPADFTIPSTGTENALIPSITTKAPAAAYWQRVVLEKGIDAYRYDGSGTYSYVDPQTGDSHTVNLSNIQGITVDGNTYSYTITDTSGETITITVNQGDYINANGEKVLDAKGLYASSELSDKVKLIPMIRNFAQIQVKSTMDGFTINQVALINTPKEGFVSPYNDTKNEFVYSYSHVDPEQPFKSSDIDTSGYLATIPAAGINVPTVNETTQKLEGVEYKRPADGIVTFFMYERGLPSASASPTMLLIQGTKAGAAARWYKIELTEEDGSYFPIYRDFTYVVDIKGLNADGYTSPEEAFANSPVGDLSASEETKTLTQIDDGKGLTMWVEYIDYTDMDANPDEHEVTLLYKLYHTSSGATPVTTGLNQYVVPEIKAYANTDAAIKRFTTATYTGPDASTPDGKGGWYQATVTLDGVGTNMKKSDLHVAAELTADQNPGGYAKKISRDVTYRVLPKQPITVSATELASEDADETTDVTITLPANLGYSVFPLTLMIEAGNNVLMTTEGLAVETGRTITGGTQNTFYYLKTINYSEYEASRVYTCHFKTTRPGTTANSNATTIYVKDKEGRFDLASCELTVRGSAPVFALSSAGVTVTPNATTASFTVRSSSSETWTLTTDDPDNVKVNPASGSGNRNVTVTFPRSNTSSPVTHTVTAILGNDPTTALYFTIKQELTLTLSADSGEATADGGWTMPVKASETTASFRVTTNSTADWTITSNNVTSATRDGSTSTVNVTFPDNMSGSEPVTRTVTVSIGGVSKTFTIMQNVPQPVEKSVTLATNNSTLPSGNIYTDTNTGVSIQFSAVDNRNASYIQLNRNNNRSVTINTNDTDYTLSAVEIYWYESNNNDYYSTNTTANPNNAGTIQQATSNTTAAKWTANQNQSRTNIALSFQRNNNFIRIARIIVTYRTVE